MIGSLVSLSCLFLILFGCLVAGEISRKFVINIRDQTFSASLPQEFDKSIDGFQGYFVGVNDTTGCNSNLKINHLQEGEKNENNFVTYIDWSGERVDDCTFENVIKNLRSVVISQFVLIDPHNSRDKRSYGNAKYVLLDEHDADDLKSLVSKAGELRMIEVTAPKETDNTSTIPMSSMAILFVTVAFVTLMTVSIGWLVFYYAQRCRQRNMRERMQSRLCVAAKRAVSKLPTKTVPDLPKTSKKIKKSTPPVPDNDSTCSSLSSNEDADFCPVCLDLYKPREVIRILPCKHEFHKNCVDPWLFDHRTCPMCKLDILEHLGMPSAGDRLDTPVVQPSPQVMEQSENVSGRVDQEVQTDFVNPPSPQHSRSTVALRIAGDDEIEPAPISPPSV